MIATRESLGAGRQGGHVGLAVVPVALALAGCSAAGPGPVDSGQYRLYATSAGEASAAGARLVVAGSSVTLKVDSEITARQMGQPGAKYLVCPPSGRGSPILLDGALAVGDLRLDQPAVFGDCGRATPSRVTVVDLASVNEANQFPFARWAEFCDLADGDCS